MKTSRWIASWQKFTWKVFWKANGQDYLDLNRRITLISRYIFLYFHRNNL